MRQYKNLTTQHLRHILMHGEEKKTSLRQPGSLFAKKLLEGLSGVKSVSNLILVKPHPLPSNLKQQIRVAPLDVQRGQKAGHTLCKRGVSAPGHIWIEQQAGIRQHIKCRSKTLSRLKAM